MALLADDVSILAIVDLSLLHSDADRTLQQRISWNVIRSVIKYNLYAITLRYLIAVLHYGFARNAGMYDLFLDFDGASSIILVWQKKEKDQTRRKMPKATADNP